MNKKVLYICVGILLVAVISLSTYIAIRKPLELECDHIHLDDDMRLWGRSDAVPDEEIAKKIADIIINAQSGFYSDLTYEVVVTFDSDRNEWDVFYDPGAVTGGAIRIYIRRDCGMITGMVFYP